jgi:hypothetical protein
MSRISADNISSRSGGTIAINNGINISGVVTATSFVGSGVNLTGISSTSKSTALSFFFGY